MPFLYWCGIIKFKSSQYFATFGYNTLTIFGAGVSSFQESFSKDGRADLVIPFEDKIIIIEFKFAKSSKEVDKKRAEGQEQVTKYAESYKNEGKKIITVVLVADNEKKQVVL